ncbi:MAG TPA: DUF1569 domain-containing protein [Phycisphaerales bacterium]|nr:DUF1569 domain-containing protein [Phycisphaerales bacterium]
MSAVDTKQVRCGEGGRRVLRFASIDDALRDAELIADADRKGTLKRCGNWTPGQALGHVAGWINFALDGYPPDLRPPWFVKVILRAMKGKYMRGLPAGARIPGIEGGTKNIEVLSTDEGLSRLRTAWKRLASTAPTRPNPVFGPLSHDEWIAINLRHAELHQSFFTP